MKAESEGDNDMLCNLFAPCLALGGDCHPTGAFENKQRVTDAAVPVTYLC